MPERALVVARYRRHSLIESASGERIVCQLSGRGLSPVVGDEVEWQPQPDGTGVVTEALPRSSALTRIDSRGNPEVVAANLSQLVVVLAPNPPPDWFLLDRYLCAAELAELRSVVVLNKVDLIDTPPLELADYEDLADSICLTSAKQGTGLASLATTMAGQRSAMIGQSGVGKSSLINALIRDAEQAVAELSEKSGQGRHTTSTAVLFPLPDGGELIDSPGVRDYAPYIPDSRQVAQGFREFRRRANNCRFDDCRHLAEPDCAVKAAVDGGEISARRYESFKTLLELTETVQNRRA